MKLHKFIWLGLISAVGTHWGGLPRRARETPSAVVFYVSTLGDDSWSGRVPQPRSDRRDGPFRTITHGRDAVRDLKTRGPLEHPVTVYLRGGTYELQEPLVFRPGDSGSPGNPVTYAAYGDEIPRLSGGRAITGWKRVAGTVLYEMLEGTGAKAPPPDKTAVWTAQVPRISEGRWEFHELFIDGRRQIRARAPNTGFFRVEGEISSDKPARFKFHQGDVRATWAKKGDVEVIGLLKWAEFRMPITAVDEVARTVTMAGERQRYGNVKNARYWIENTFDALDAPSEWYLNRRAGVVYYCSRPGDTVLGGRFVAPVLQQLVRFEGAPHDDGFVHDITLKGLVFSDTDWSMPAVGYVDQQAAFDIPATIEGIGARSCNIVHCSFSNLGGYAVEFHQGSRQDRVTACTMADLGAGGVKIGDPRLPTSDPETTGEIVVEGNRILEIGRVYPAAVGVWVGQSGHNTIAHNEIGRSFYTGISVGWTWGYGPAAARDNLIAFNDIHDLGQGMLSDMGCIYTLGVQPGTVERNNRCHDVRRDDEGYGGWGIYTDEGSSDIVIENNVVFRTQDGGFHQHYGRDNLVRNNIFALGQTAQVRRTREEGHLSFTFERNIVYWKDGRLLDGRWDDNQYRFDYNLYFRAAGGPVNFGRLSFEEWRSRGQDIHSLLAAPRFADPEAGNFSLLPGSPAMKLGFVPILLAGVGPQRP